MRAASVVGMYRVRRAAATTSFAVTPRVPPISLLHVIHSVCVDHVEVAGAAPHLRDRKKARKIAAERTLLLKLQSVSILISGRGSANIARASSRYVATLRRTKWPTAFGSDAGNGISLLATIEMLRCYATARASAYLAFRTFSLIRLNNSACSTASSSAL